MINNFRDYKLATIKSLELTEELIEIEERYTELTTKVIPELTQELLAYNPNHFEEMQER